MLAWLFGRLLVLAACPEVLGRDRVVLGWMAAVVAGCVRVA
jgi:hypothetical protein